MPTCALVEGSPSPAINGHTPPTCSEVIRYTASGAAFGLMLASVCHSRMQLVALSNLSILVMSALGGSMVPRYLLSEKIQKLGLVTLNAWAIDGFVKVFWREEPLVNLWPQAAVLLADRRRARPRRLQASPRGRAHRARSEPGRGTCIQPGGLNGDHRHGQRRAGHPGHRARPAPRPLPPRRAGPDRAAAVRGAGCGRT